MDLLYAEKKVYQNLLSFDPFFRGVNFDIRPAEFRNT